MGVTTAVVFDRRYLAHDTGQGHPECPERLAAIMTCLERGGLCNEVMLLPGRPADLQWVRLVHSDTYLARLEAACRQAEPYIDCPDSAICPASYEVALLAAGGVLSAVDAVAAQTVQTAFCAVRPPGHHAERDRSMGFCLLNNVAIAARYAQRHCHLQRILIVDWDVHHGNATQQAFEEDPTVLYCSLHEHPASAYPGTGWSHEQGTAAGAGTTLNLPMPPGAGDADYQRAFQEQLLPLARRFRPDLVLISAGFDAHRDDPLSQIELTDPCFEWMLAALMALAAESCNGRIVSVLEGGYNLDVLGRCVASHVRLLAGGPGRPAPPTDPAAKATGTETR